MCMEWEVVLVAAEKEKTRLLSFKSVATKSPLSESEMRCADCSKETNDQMKVFTFLEK